MAPAASSVKPRTLGDTRLTLNTPGSGARMGRMEKAAPPRSNRKTPATVTPTAKTKERVLRARHAAHQLPRREGTATWAPSPAEGEVAAAMAASAAATDKSSAAPGVGQPPSGGHTGGVESPVFFASHRRHQSRRRRRGRTSEEVGEVDTGDAPIGRPGSRELL